MACAAAFIMPASLGAQEARLYDDGDAFRDLPFAWTCGVARSTPERCFSQYHWAACLAGI